MKLLTFFMALLLPLVSTSVLLAQDKEEPGHEGYDHAPGKGHEGHDHAPGEGHEGEAEAKPARGALEAVRALIVAGDFLGAERRLPALERQEGVARVDAWALRGLVDLQLGRPAAAARLFRKVLAQRATKVAVWLYLGQALFAQKDYLAALAALKKGRKVGANMPGYWVLMGRSQLHLKRPHSAYLTFARAARRFPRDRQIQRERLLVLVELKLFSAALDQGRRYLAAAPDDPHGYLLLGEALRKAGGLDEAIRVLEQARVRFLGNARVLARLAHAYAQKQMPLAAARLLERAALVDQRHAHQAAEQYRLARRWRDALRCNGLISEQHKKLRQRLAVLVAAERWPLAAALAAPLAAAGPLRDSDRYLLAHALLRAGRLDEADRLAAAITDTTFSDSAARLRSTIARQRRAGRED